MCAYTTVLGGLGGTRNEFSFETFYGTRRKFNNAATMALSILEATPGDSAFAKQTPYRLSLDQLSVSAALSDSQKTQTESQGQIRKMR